MRFFRPYQMSPYGWGHSQLLGRVKYHLRWTFRALNVKKGTHELIQYFQQQSTFPEVQHFGENKLLLEKLLHVKGLDAYQVASVMIVIVFALACCSSTLVTDAMRKSWRLENVVSVDYYRKAFTEEQIRNHTQNCEWYEASLVQAYSRQEGVDLLEGKVKLHDLKHDETIIRDYGSFLIINELPKESAHQLAKQTPHNNRTVEEQMLAKVTKEG